MGMFVSSARKLTMMGGSIIICTFNLISQYSDSLWVGKTGVRIPVGGDFFAPVQTGPGAHPASYTMGTVSFPGVKWPGCGINHPPPFSAKVKERVQLYLWAFEASSRSNLTFTFTFFYSSRNLIMIMKPVGWDGCSM